jgi:uncharacterized protein YndB with AHSA1/START domain
MMTNLDQHLSVRLQRDFRAPVARVFEAWSNPAFITKWWKNLDVAKMDFRPGGELELRWKSWDGRVTGTFREIVQNERIVFTWSADPTPEGCAESRVTLELEDRGEITRLTLTHDLNADKAEADMHRDGWSKALIDLAARHPRAVSPVAVVRNIRAPAARIYAALTQSEHLDKWFFTRCTTDPREGGDYEILWESTKDPDRNHRRFGRYLELVENERVRFEWRGLALDNGKPPTEVMIELSEREDGTTDLALTHTGWGASSPWFESRDQHESGWIFYVDNLARYLHAGPDLRGAFFGQHVTSSRVANA